MVVEVLAAVLEEADAGDASFDQRLDIGFGAIIRGTENGGSDGAERTSSRGCREVIAAGVIFKTKPRG